MYLGAILMFVGAPLVLGSLYGVLVGFALTILLMARIRGGSNAFKGPGRVPGIYE